MTILLLFAFVSGVITILSPCILPVLPIVLSGGVSGGKARPFGVLAGFVASFTVFTLTLTAVVQALGVPSDALRFVAVVLVILLGIVLIVPKLREAFESAASRIANAGTRKNRTGYAGTGGSGGFWGGLPIGFSLGLVWTPCVGPIMASVISLALTQKVDGGAVLITLAYTLGTSIPMLAIMIGGRALLNRVPFLTRHTAGIQKGFGVLMILVGVAIAAGWDRQFQAAVLRVLPGYGAGLSAVENAAPVREALRSRGSAPSGAEPKGGVLGDYGPAPAFVTDGGWFNTQGPAGTALRMEDLRGKVVLVDFWTYSCVNCVRTIPYLKAWYDAYRKDGLVIVGVHTPEFEFEKSAVNVARAIKDLGVDWPVVQDNQFAQWNAYANQYWPAHYFIDARGRIRYFHYGEGDYQVSEGVLRALLKEAGTEAKADVTPPPAPILARTPETYLGYARADGFTSAVPAVNDQPSEYRPAGVPANGKWTLTGRWTIAGQYIVAESSGILELGFNARNVFLVVEPEAAGGGIAVSVDGKRAADTADVKDGTLRPDASRLYQLVGLEAPGPHVLRLEVKGKLRLYAFTFG